MGQPGLQSKCKARLEYSETNLKKKKKKGNWLEVKMQTVLAQDHCIQFPKLMLGGSQLAVTQAPEDPKSVASAGTCTQTYINKNYKTKFK